MSNGTTTWNMTYDADGLRTSRIATDSEGNVGSKYYYYYENGLLTYMKFNSLVMRFTYDANGTPVSMTYNGNTYFYALNLQGDVVALLDSSGNEVVAYHYNAWGQLLSTTASTETMRLTLAKYNPLRYRGYVYDRETGLYYLQSRYYNPTIGRFISSDNVDYMEAFSVSGINLFAYCSNNPINRYDLTGNAWDTVLDIGFICWDIYDLCVEEGYKEWENWAALGADLIFTAIPFLTGGSGKVIKLANVGDDLNDLS